MTESPAKVLIISPALRAANNGNWRTAYRWSGFLRPRFDVAIRSAFTEDDGKPQCLIALHARRSADAVAHFAARCPGCPRVVVLTGTDLYRDLPHDPGAQHTLDLATHLVVLQPAALHALEARHRTRTRVIFQSAPALARCPPRRNTFDVVLVGHMRPEKDPVTAMRALQWLPPESRVRLLHIGEAPTEAYANAAHELQRQSRRYRWLGPRPHGETRRHIRRSKALVISSIMEGGANVIVEAVTCGVPVLASRISGNIGMLGEDYDGYFSVGADRELARLLVRISADPMFLTHLEAQCAARAPLFAPQRERAEVDRLLDDALATSPAAPAESAACVARS